MADDETQTLDEGRSDQNVQMRILITKNGKAALCRYDCPFLLQSYSIQALSWCSHCDPSDVLEKRTWCKEYISSYRKSLRKWLPRTAPTTSTV